MPDDVADPGFRLHACRELLEAHPQSLHIREQVEAIEEAIPDRPGVVVSFCKAIIETTCKTILTDRGAAFDGAWDTPKLVSESMKFLNLSSNQSGVSDTKLRTSTQSLARGLSQIVQGVVGIRNSYGSAAHGADAYAPRPGVPIWLPS